MLYLGFLLTYRPSVIPDPTHAQKSDNEFPDAGNCFLPRPVRHLPGLFLDLDESGVNELLLNPTGDIQSPEASHHVIGVAYQLVAFVRGCRAYARTCWAILHDLDPTARFSLPAHSRNLVSLGPIGQPM